MKTFSDKQLASLETPAVLLDWQQMIANIREMASHCAAHGVRLMPHMKTPKSVAIARAHLEAGACGLTVAKISEARAILESGVRRIFLAYPISSPNKVSRLIELSRLLDELIVAGTSPEQIRRFSGLLESSGCRFPCLLGLDTGLGREGARDLDALREMKSLVEQSESLTYRGIFSHEGFTYTSSPGEIPAQSRQVAARLREARQALGDSGELWPGCSVTARHMAGEPGITGLRPGAYLFGDLFLTDFTGAMGREALALCMAATVVDKPEPGLALIDAGSKVFSSDKNPNFPYNALPLDGSDYALTRMSEEHGFLTGPDTARLSLGQVVTLIPAHVCPVVNLSERYSVFKDGAFEHIPVEARGCVW